MFFFNSDYEYAFSFIFHTHISIKFHKIFSVAQHVYDSIYEENHQKRRQLDILRFEKKKKMKQCFNLQVRYTFIYLHVYVYECII